METTVASPQDTGSSGPLRIYRRPKDDVEDDVVSDVSNEPQANTNSDSFMVRQMGIISAFIHSLIGNGGSNIPLEIKSVIFDFYGFKSGVWYYLNQRQMNVVWYSIIRMWNMAHQPIAIEPKADIDNSSSITSTVKSLWRSLKRNTPKDDDVKDSTDTTIIIDEKVPFHEISVLVHLYLGHFSGFTVKPKKVLILGSMDSGKSTFFRHHVSLYGTGYDEKDRKGFGDTIYNVFVEQTRSLLEYIEEQNAITLSAEGMIPEKLWRQKHLHFMQVS